MSNGALRFPPLVGLLLTGLLGACAPTAYGAYVANDGRVLRDVDPEVAFRTSAAHDLRCDARAISVYYLPDERALDLPSPPGSITTRFLLNAAEGCGARVVYKRQCGAIEPMLPPPSTAREARTREWTLDGDREQACRHVLVSRVALDPAQSGERGALSQLP